MEAGENVVYQVNLPQTESMSVVMSCQLHVGCATIAAC